MITLYWTVTALYWIAAGIAVVIGLCFLHGRVAPSMPRVKFVVCGLLLLGEFEFVYIGLWAFTGQHPYPLFSLHSALYFVATMWVSAMLYSTVYVLRLRDIAPSK